MSLRSLYFVKGAQVIEFLADIPRDGVGMVEVRIQAVHDGVSEPAAVADILTQHEFRQLLDDHRATGYQECNRFGRLAEAEALPHLHLLFKDPLADAPAPAVPHATLPVESARAFPQEPMMPSPKKPEPTLNDVLALIRDKVQGWDGLTTEEQLTRRNAIYALRVQARKLAKVEGLGKVDLPVIPAVVHGVEAQPVAAEEAKATGEKEAGVSLDTIKGTISNLRRQVWVVMAGTETLGAEDERLAVAEAMGSLSLAAQCAADSLRGRIA